MLTLLDRCTKGMNNKLENGANRFYTEWIRVQIWILLLKIMLKILWFTNRKCGFGLYKPAAWVYSNNMENLIKIPMLHLPLSKKQPLALG